MHGFTAGQSNTVFVGVVVAIIAGFTALSFFSAKYWVHYDD